MAKRSHWPYSHPPWVNRDGPFPAPTASQLAAFEKRHALELPAVYRSFLVNFRGGPPEGCDVRVAALREARTVRELYPLESRSDGADLQGCVDWEEFMPRELLAFADDGYGSWFCLGVRGAAWGKIFYVSCDLEHDDPRRVASVAPSFQKFLQKCRPPEPVE